MRAPDTILPLDLDRVGFAVGERSLLDGISLRLEAGLRTVILGPNGAGKSLLLRLCHGLLEPSIGRVKWVGAEEGEKVRRRQAMVFQRPVLLRRSALANIRYVLALRGVPWHKRGAQAMEALERFGLGSLALRPARVLSGGEQQRLALARAWASRPDILFLDEPTSSLDPAAALSVEMAVREFHASGTKIVMTTHDLGQARRLADEVVFLFQGRLVEHAPAAEFFKEPRSAQARAFLAGELVY
ncbi:ABC-type tungstate transport system ATP-binding protein [Paramagnetospirillum magnetotacticum MS-1]|uniref:ABC-type tungstate transport system ATP-binding protein n=1 Tax=Paramagnetospirillum magnetotacticum MS-1 TaxID=272627 RepID=A0A0C2YYH1_PARME|nr:ATP-binding cassette domain-containing protein [Paramagnetospirillum magnetotacticum]KIM00119.1 ABC-type tungstate transport system ATP-binding protein [Paramagnetospirillum magnetotacticum MS-1]